MRTRIAFGAVAAAAALGLALAGCSQPAPNTGGDPTAEPTQPTETGAAPATDAPLQEGWPNDVPLPPNDEELYSSSNDGKRQTAMGSATEAELEAYLGELKGAGFAETSNTIGETVGKAELERGTQTIVVEATQNGGGGYSLHVTLTAE